MALAGPFAASRGVDTPDRGVGLKWRGRRASDGTTLATQGNRRRAAGDAAVSALCALGRVRVCGARADEAAEADAEEEAEAARSAWSMRFESWREYVTYWSRQYRIEGECWIADGWPSEHSGYPRASSYRGKQWYGTHIALAAAGGWSRATTGIIFAALQGCHNCKSRDCIRPDHLRPCTPDENAADKRGGKRAERQGVLMGYEESDADAEFAELDLLDGGMV